MASGIREQMITYRAKHNIGQREFARRCGLSTVTVNSVENGLQEPTERTIAKIMLVIEGGKDNDAVRDRKTD